MLAMSEIGDAFLARARESLDGAAGELGAGRYNNAANRAYYACFQAAVAALDHSGLRPSPSADRWSHAAVQAQFVGQLVNRRKLYPAQFRDLLNQVRRVREQGDYSSQPVSESQAARALARARGFVDAVTAQGGSDP